MWYQIEYLGSNTYRVQLKPWHPGFWFHVFTTLKGQGVETLDASLLLLLLAWNLVRRRKS